MNEKKFLYSFEAWKKGEETKDFLNRDTIELFAESLDRLIEKIKLFNKIACFECWTSLKFYKWDIILFKKDTLVNSIVDACYFPEMIGAHKIKVWGITYEI